MQFKHKKKKISFLIILLVVVAIISINSMKEIKKSNLKTSIKANIEEINAICNGVIEDVEGHEKKYSTLLQKEKDPLKRGIYYSAMSQINAIKGDSKGIVENSKKAIENYNKIEGGEYLSIAENKQLAWVMLRVGGYTESFEAANEVMVALKTDTKEILTNNEIRESEALMYSIFTIIYSELDLKENAKFYYDKLGKIDLSEESERKVGDKIYYSQMIYTEYTKDYKNMKKYAEKYYDVASKKDPEAADGTILNLALANMFNGDIRLALEQMETAEKFFNRVGDQHSLGVVYLSYADAYKLSNDNEKAIENYKKAIDSFLKVGDKFRAKTTLNKFIAFSKEKGLTNLFNSYYKEIYEFNGEIQESSSVNDLLEKSLVINEDLSNNRITYIKKEADNMEKRNELLLGVIILLIIMCNLIWNLYKNKIKNEKILEDVINRDYLTGVSTRDYGFKMLKSFIKNRYKLSLAIIDIDNFKSINDTYGHLLGDEVLKEVAKMLKEKVGKEDLIIRFGGEEFIIVFKDIKKDEGKIILDNIREELYEKKFRDMVNISFSAGIDDFNNDDLHESLDKIDKLLYEAKKSGKNKIIVG